MAGGSSFSSSRRIARARASEFSIVSKYALGYRNREDVTNLPPGVLIVGSQNVLTNVSERIQIRQGYALDGDMSAVAAPVLSSFDWLTRGNGERNMRAGGLTSAGNDGKLQFRYVDADGVVSWIDLMTGLDSVSFNFTKFWDTTESLRVALFVNGSSNIYKWNGAIASIASVDNTAGHIAEINATPTAAGSGYVVGDVLTITTGGTSGTVTVTSIGGGGSVTGLSLTTTGSGYTGGTGRVTSGGTGTGCTVNITTVATGQIVINGTDSVLDAGFNTTSALNLVINGTTYAYGYVLGKSFLGISPSAVAQPVDSVITQAVVTTANSILTSGPPSDFKNGLISTLNNQVFLGGLTSPSLWISNVNSYTDYSSSTPRETGEGAVLILDDNLVALKPQEQFMYVTCGQDLWYNVNFEIQTSTVGVTYEQVNAELLKNGRQQAAQSQAFVSHMKNDIIVLTNEPTVDSFGRVETSLATPQMTNISDPIKLDLDQYDFTDGCIFYFQYYILLAVPREGLVRIFNLNTRSWEAPMTIPVSRFYIVDGELYGHSYNTFESYKLFTGYADRVYPGSAGLPILAKWVFSFQNYGSRFSYKDAQKFYVEGYIAPNTTMTAKINYELDGCKTTRMLSLSGNNQQFVCLSAAEGSIGKESLGKVKLGGDQAESIQGLPPKFRWMPTFTNKPFFEVNFEFSVLGVNQRMELLAYGLAVSGSKEITVQNTA